MKDQYIAEIVQYVNAQDENHVRCLAELSRVVDKAKLTYILTFLVKMFGSR